MSKKKNWILFLFNLVGANSYIWKKRHIESHHTYPNIDGWDTDIDQSGPIQVVPGQETKGVQRYQDKFVFFIYPLLSQINQKQHGFCQITYQGGGYSDRSFHFTHSSLYKNGMAQTVYGEKSFHKENKNLSNKEY